jgi:hypothetical protein
MEAQRVVAIRQFVLLKNELHLGHVVAPGTPHAHFMTVFSLSNHENDVICQSCQPSRRVRGE